MTTSLKVGTRGFAIAAVLVPVVCGAAGLSDAVGQATDTATGNVYDVSIKFPDYLEFVKQVEKKANRRDAIQIKPGKYVSENAFPPTFEKDNNCDNALVIVTNPWVILMPVYLALGALLLFLNFEIGDKEVQKNSATFQNPTFTDRPARQRTTKQPLGEERVGLRRSRCRWLRGAALLLVTAAGVWDADLGAAARDGVL